MSQNDKKIVEALREWKEPIEGWFWDEDDKNCAIRSNLLDFDLRGVSNYGSEGAYWENFSLTNPNEKKKIECRDEMKDFAKANPKTLFKFREQIVINPLCELNTNFCGTNLSDLLIQTSLTEWTPITEIEVE